MNIFKRVWCWLWGHKWAVKEGQDLLRAFEPPVFKCSHCGKEEGL